MRFTCKKVWNNFVTIDYDANINTKIDNTNNHGFRSLTVKN